MTTPTAHHQLAPGLSREYLMYHRVCPRERTANGSLRLAAAPDAFLEDAIADLEALYDCPILVEEVTDAEVERMIARCTIDLERPVELVRDETAEEQLADARDLANQAPVIRLLNLLVRDAYGAQASDIHVEASPDGVRTRFRLDGVLVPAIDCPQQYQQAIVSRVKLLANLDIAERRRPQDGRIRVRLDERDLDLRVSTVPTSHGESVVLRLLDRGGAPVALGELGMSDDVFTGVSRYAKKPHGLFVVTGPTGSGKTTTLYAALQLRSADAEKIITVEDPIEYQLKHVVQVPVHRTGGITFAAALRSILRQDPDVVMIGETRDRETAEIAVQAAMTGHLVFTTLHTNDAISAVPRLTDLGVPDYLIAATLEGVVSQRLVRRICSNCVERLVPSLEVRARMGEWGHRVDSLARGKGCSECRQTGYKGRTGIFEFFPITDPLRDLIAKGAKSTDLRLRAVEEGVVPLEHDAWRKVADFTTTVDEVLRVLQN